MAGLRRTQRHERDSRPSGRVWTGFAPQIASQIVGQFLSRGIALAGLLVQAFQTDGFQIARRARLQSSGRHRFIARHLNEGFQRRRPLERRPAREQFVEDGAQRIHVGMWADRVLLALRCSGAM